MTSPTARVTDPDALRSLYGEVPRRAAGKVHARLDRHDRAYVGQSPFLVLATAARNGLLDVSRAATGRASCTSWTTSTWCCRTARQQPGSTRC